MAERVVRNVENDYLMCSICLGRYNDPRLLPCGHTFCRQCLEDHIKQTVTDRGSQFFTCPNDRTQVPRPRPGLAPKDWANVFPTDTFLCSLLHAVMIHASPVSGDTDQMTCETHSGRIKEFFCLKCAKSACALCVVKTHKASSCECMSVEEAVDKSQPKLDVLRGRLHKQLQQARQVLKGEDNQGNHLKHSKDQAMMQLTDLETKLGFYYTTAIKQIQDMTKTIQEAGSKQVTGNQQVNVIMQNINETVDKLEEVSNNGSGTEILNLIPRLESQVIDYEHALKSLSSHSPVKEVHFVTNNNMERIFENAPVLGSVVLQVNEETSRTPRHGIHSAMNYQPYVPTPRDSLPSSARSSMSNASTPRRSVDLSSRMSDLTPQRAKLTIDVRCDDQPSSCWQLTGVALVGNYIIITDAHNGKVVKCQMNQIPSLHEELTLECPVCVAGMQDSLNVMVTLPEKGKLAIVATEAELVLEDTIDTSKPYEGISQLTEGRFVVSCCVVGRQCVDVIDSTGQLLNSIDTDASGNPLFSWPRFLSSTPSGKILVSDRDQRSLILLDNNGARLWVHQAPASPWGVSCHEDGTIFLCMDNNEVETLTEGGRLITRRYLDGRDGIKVPYAIHAQGEHIIVTEWGSQLFSPNSPYIHVFFIED